MKYFIILLLLTSSFSFAQSSSSAITTQTITGGDYNVHKLGSPVFTPYSNQTYAKSAAGKLSKECLCKVEVIQPTLLLDTTVVSTSSSSIVATISIISFDRPTTREGGGILTAGEIKGYELTRLSGVETIPASGDSITYITTPPQQGEVFTLVTVDTKGLRSDSIKIQPITGNL